MYKPRGQMRGRGLLIEPQYLITTIKKSVYIALLQFLEVGDDVDQPDGDVE